MYLRQWLSHLKNLQHGLHSQMSLERLLQHPIHAKQQVFFRWLYFCLTHGIFIEQALASCYHNMPTAWRLLLGCAREHGRVHEGILDLIHLAEAELTYRWQQLQLICRLLAQIGLAGIIMILLYHFQKVQLTHTTYAGCLLSLIMLVCLGTGIAKWYHQCHLAQVPWRMLSIMHRYHVSWQKMLSFMEKSEFGNWRVVNWQVLDGESLSISLHRAKLIYEGDLSRLQEAENGGWLDQAWSEVIDQKIIYWQQRQIWWLNCWQGLVWCCMLLLTFMMAYMLVSSPWHSLKNMAGLDL